MSRSHHARRGSRKGRRAHPYPPVAAEIEEGRQQNMATMGAPTAHAARSLQGARGHERDYQEGDPFSCGCGCGGPLVDAFDPFEEDAGG